MHELDLAMSMRDGTLHPSIDHAPLHYFCCSNGSTVCRLPKECPCRLPDHTKIDEAAPNAKYKLAPTSNGSQRFRYEQ